MNAFFKDFKYGDFVASEWNLIPISFDNSIKEDEDLAMGGSTVEEYIGRKSIPVDLGTEYHGKMKFDVTFGKNPCNVGDRTEFSLFEIRAILRELTGKQYYEKLYFMDDIGGFRYDEPVYYKAKVTNVSRSIVGESTYAITVSFECDSFWQYTEELNKNFSFYKKYTDTFYNNSDEINDYLYPTVIIKNPKNAISQLNIKVVEDGKVVDKQTGEVIKPGGRTTILKDIPVNTTITLDGQNEIITYSPDGTIQDSFNLKFPRFVPGENNIEFECDGEVEIEIKYHLLRKGVW